MQLRKLGIYAVLLYGLCYITGSFLELSSSEKNYKSMTETVQLAAESAVQSCLYGAEYDYPSIVDPDSVFELQKQLTGSAFVDFNSGDRAKISKYLQEDFATYTNANRMLTISPIPLLAQSNSSIYSALSNAATADTQLTRSETLISSALLRDNTSFSAVSDAEIRGVPYGGLVSGSLVSAINNVSMKYHSYNSALYNYYYSDNTDWKKVANIAGYIKTDIKYPIVNVSPAGVIVTDSVYYKPNILDMGVQSLRGVNVKFNVGGPSGALKSFMIQNGGTIYNMNSVVSGTGSPTTFINNYINNLQNAYADTLSFNNRGAFSTNYLGVSDYDNFSLRYYSPVTPVNVGVTYLDRQLLEQLFLDNMNKLMLGREPSVLNLGYCTDEQNHTVASLIQGGALANLQPSEQTRLNEIFDNGIINNGYFNFALGKLTKVASDSYLYESKYATTSTYAQNHSGSLRDNLPTIEYKTIEIHDTANDEILKMIYLSDSALANARAASSEKYIVVAKITFFSDVSISYTNMFARDAVYVGSHKWTKGSAFGLITTSGSTYHYMSNDANAATSIYTDQASIRGLHRFTLNGNVTTPLSVYNARYSPVTGNVMYEYTTYAAVVN